MSEHPINAKAARVLAVAEAALERDGLAAAIRAATLAAMKETSRLSLEELVAPTTEPAERARIDHEAAMESRDALNVLSCVGRPLVLWRPEVRPAPR